MGSKLPSIEDYRANKVSAAALEMVDRWRWEGLQNTNWRKDSQIDHDYYDGNQMTSQVLQDMEDRGIPAIVCNLVGPTIDLVLGMEAQTRTDWVCRPDGGDPRYDDLAMALSQQLHQAERLSGADDACSNAAANLFKGGIGWVEVKRESDPFKYRYSVARRDWREFWLDPFCQQNDLSDARYLRRAKFYDRDLLCKMFAGKAEALSTLNYGSARSGLLGSDRSMTEAEMLSRGSIAMSRDYSITDLDWMDVERDRLQLEEFWYRVYVRGEVMRLLDGTAIEYNKADPVHNAALERGMAVLVKCVYSVMRVGFWVGPLCLQDIPSPYPHRDFPYVPFWGMREDRTGVPYGLVRRMRAPQDEVNARRSKMLWGLSARRVLASPGGTPDHDLARQEVARPDAYIIVSDQPNQVFKVDDNMGVNEQQFKAYLDARQLLQDSGGVFQAQLGKEQTGQSGVAIANLVEQGSTTLAPMFANFRRARSKVGQLLLSLVSQDLAGREQRVMIEGRDGAKRGVVLNKRANVEGIDVIQNDVSKVKLNVVLDDMPASPTFRAQQMQRIAEIVGRLPPDAQIRVLDMVVEASDVPNKAEFIKRIRELAGQAPDVEMMSPEERQAFEAQQQQAQAEQQAQKELMMRGAAAKVDLDEAKASDLLARAEKTQADTQLSLKSIEKMLVDMQSIMVKSRKTAVETDAIEQDMADQAMALAAGPPAKTEAVFRW